MFNVDDLEEVAHVNYSWQRERAKSFMLKPGIYVVIPYVKEEHREGDFLIRFQTLGPAEVEPGEDSSDPMPAHESDPLDRLFDSHCGSDGVIDCFELQTILQALLKSNLNAAEFSWVTCVELIKCFGEERKSRLNRSELKRCWEFLLNRHAVFKKIDANGDNYLNALELPKALEELKLKVGRRVVAVFVQSYGSKNGHLNFEGFITSIVILKSFSIKWAKTKDYFLGGITFDQFLLYELFGEIPDIDDHGLEAIYDPIAGKVIKEAAKHARNACAIM